jgi:predicted alpha/beta superfamily hydrolase
MRRSTSLALALILVAGLAAAGEPITIGETLHLDSKILGEQRTILVSPPPGYDRSSNRYPVLYMTDGDGHLTHTRGTVDFLVRNALMPDVIIVGVTNTDRTRDLTPTRAGITENDGAVREMPTSGGAASFLDFFEKELIPFIDVSYRTQPYRVLAGHSFGGLFALNAVFTRPELFDAVLAVSPSLRWDDDLPLRQASTLAQAHPDLSARLFVAMANEERDDPRPTRLDRLEAALGEAALPGLDLEVMRMPDETHGSVVLRAHYWGLRDIFSDWGPPRDAETGRFAGTRSDLETHYAALSKRVGYPVIPPEDIVNAVGYEVLRFGDAEAAIDIFRYNAELYPEAANPFDSLGEALEGEERLDEALASYSRSVANAAALGDPRLDLFTANRDRVKQRLEEASSESDPP